METINMPKEEYVKMIKKIELLKDKHFLRKADELIDILFQEKYYLILTDYIYKLNEYSID